MKNSVVDQFGTMTGIEGMIIGLPYIIWYMYVHLHVVIFISLGFDMRTSK